VCGSKRKKKKKRGPKEETSNVGCVTWDRDYNDIIILAEVKTSDGLMTCSLPEILGSRWKSEQLRRKYRAR
jgi:hypothetical protein